MQVHPARAVGEGESGLGPEEGLVLHPDLVGALDDDLTDALGVAVAQGQPADDVAVGVDRFGGQRELRIGQWRKRFVVDDDGGESPAGELGVLSGDECDRFAVETHDVGGEHRLVRVLEAEGRGAGDVGGRQHRAHADHRACRTRIDGADERVRVGAS